ncbi:MAG: enoyl-CoA hydratase/isomerase family protein [Pseudomonadota bacterium]
MNHLLSATDAGVLTLTLNRADALNAITPPMLESLAAALEDAAVDTDVRLVVITGAGRAFSAGVDLKALGGRPIEQGKVGDILDVPARAALACIESMSKPVVAKVNGHCFTGALEIVLACDLVYAAREAKFGDTHAKWGVRPTWGMTQRLPRKVGVSIARELGLTARTFTADEALAWGLANGVAPAAELDALVDTRIAQILENSADVLAAYKDLWRRSFGLPLADGLAVEANNDYEISDTGTRLAAFLT